MAAIVNRQHLGSDGAHTLTIKMPRRSSPRSFVKDMAEGLRQKRRAAVTTPLDEISKLSMVPYHKVSAALVALNPNIIFNEIVIGGKPEGKVSVGLKTPSKGAIQTWENLRLGYSERSEVEALKKDVGPTRWMVALSKGNIPLFETLITAHPPHHVVTRSLKDVLARCVSSGAFTWEQAERLFGVTFRGRHVTIKRIPAEARAWGNQDVISVSTSPPKPKPGKIVLARS